MRSNAPKHRPLSGPLGAVLGAFAITVCAAVVWSDSTAYGDLPIARMNSRVGVKGECCVPGAKTECRSVTPFACTTEGITCDGGSDYDRCGSPSCAESDNEDDACASEGFDEYSVVVTTCHVIPGGVVPCDENGNRCMYTTGSATVEFLGCGASTICSETSGPACQ